MSNALLKYNTVYSSKLVRKESKVKTAFKVIFCWSIPIAYLIHYRDKQDESNETIKSLQGEIQRLDRVIENQEKIRSKKQKEEQQTTLEHKKRIIKTGNKVKLEETKVCEGNLNVLNEFFNGGW